MTNLERAEQEAIVLMNRHGLIDKGWDFKFSRAKKRLGQCCVRYTNGVKKKWISLSSYYVKAVGQQDWDLVITDTIKHEIAHALTHEDGDRMFHDWKWKKKCLEVGADPTRLCAVPAELKMKIAKSVKGKIYTADCACGFAHQKYRAVKKLKLCKKTRKPLVFRDQNGNHTLDSEYVRWLLCQPQYRDAFTEAEKRAVGFNPFVPKVEVKVL